MREITISTDEANQRFDKFLLKYLNNAPKSFVYKMLRKKNIKLNGNKADGNEMLTTGDFVNLFLAEATIETFTTQKVVNAQAGDICVVYEDACVLICNKPQGVLSHPENAADNDTMIDRILCYLQRTHVFDVSKNATFTPGLCNRLDRNTTGLLVCGKTLAATQWLNKAIAEQKLNKTYKALVLGNITQAGELSGYHLKDSTRNRVTISAEATEGAKAVKTNYVPLGCYNGFTVLDITLITGKSHQIRAHLAAIRHPIVGDVKYGDPQTNALFKRKAGVKSQLLHAETLVFTEKDGCLGYLAGQLFHAPLPPLFEKAVAVATNMKSLKF